MTIKEFSSDVSTIYIVYVDNISSLEFTKVYLILVTIIFYLPLHITRNCNFNMRMFWKKFCFQRRI